MSSEHEVAYDDSVLGYGHVVPSLLLVFPLFLVYQLGLLLTPGASGVDFISQPLFDALGQDRGRYLLLHLGLAAAFLLVLFILYRRGMLELERAMPVLLEAAIYALTLGSFIIFVMDRLMGLELLAVGGETGVGNILIVAAGAGVHEEMIFRLGCMGLGGLVLSRCLGLGGMAVLLAALISSVLFSFAHHLGAAGEPFEIGVAVYRCIAGLCFAAIFYYRSLAHAVFSHFLYDLYVLGMA